MAPDDDDGDELPLGKPLPPDDRLWRHPSEMTGEAGKQQIVLVSKSSPSLGRTLVIAMLAGLIGAGTTIGVVLGTNILVKETPGKPSVSVRDVSPQPTPGASEIETADKVLPAIARVEAIGPKGTVSATGFVFRSDGLIVTTADAVDGAQEITVYLRDGTKVPPEQVQLVGKSLEADVAVVRVPRVDLPVATLPNYQVSLLEKTVMVDASSVTRGPEVTVGVVTNESTQVNREDNSPVYGLIETTTRASVGPRSPGTVFLNSAGTVIGLVTSRAEPPVEASATTTPPATGRPTTTTPAGNEANAVHFAIPADYVWRIATQLSEKGQVVKPWVGIQEGVTLSADEADRNSLVSGGMKIRRLEPDSPATQSDGLRVDDIIVALDEDNVGGYNDWVTALRRHDPGSTVIVTVVRNGDYLRPYLTIGGKPEL